MAGNDLPPIYQSTFRTRFEFNRKKSSTGCRPPGLPVPAISLVVKGSAPHASQQSVNDVEPRIMSLQRNIRYLQQQHADTLEKLHAEIEFLKRENKELKYRLTMDSNKAGKKGVGIVPNRNAKSSCQFQSGLNAEEQFEDTQVQDQASREVNETPRTVQLDHGGELTGLRKTILAPVTIDHSPSDLPGPSSMQDSESIQQLLNVNSLQTQEIARLKALLSDIILSKKITREHQILSKTYLADEPCEAGEEKKFSKLGSNPLPSIISGPSCTAVVLPELKQSLSSNAANRQKKLMSIHRHHLQRGFR